MTIKHSKLQKIKPLFVGQLHMLHIFPFFQLSLNWCLYVQTTNLVHSTGNPLTNQRTSVHEEIILVPYSLTNMNQKIDV